MNNPYDPLSAISPGRGLEHSPSYWTATLNTIADDDGPAPAQVDAEVAIIGAGYTGLACAYHLARDYGLRPVVLEANRAGWGGSGRNGGFSRAAIGRLSAAQLIERFGVDVARRVLLQARTAVGYVLDLINTGNLQCDLVTAGHLKIAHRASRAKALRLEAELLQKEFAYPVEFFEADELRGKHIAGTQSFGALRFPDGMAVHPLKLALGVLRLARNAGAKVHGASPVLGWKKDGAEHVLSTPHGTVRARSVVIATDGYTPEHLHRCLGGTLLPVLSHIIVTRPMTQQEKRASSFFTDHVLTDTRNLLYYWRRLPDDRILFGGRGLITDSPSGHARQRAFLLSELKVKLPALEEITVDYDWSGWLSLAADFVPHVYHAVEDPSVHYALAYMGSGVSYGLYAGKLLAMRIGGGAEEAPIPSTTTPLPRFPFPAMRRMGQRAMYVYYRYLDRRD